MPCFSFLRTTSATDAAGDHGDILKRESFTPFERFVNRLAHRRVFGAVLAVAPVMRPIYTAYDSLFPKAIPKGSDEAKPVVIFSMLHVEEKDLEDYRRLFAEYATKAQANGKGVRACFSFLKENTALQVTWLDSALDLAPHPQALLDMYCEGGTVAVFGEWDAGLKATLDSTFAGKATIDYNDGMAGFVKEASASHAQNFKTGQPAIIYISRRKIQAGKLDVMQKNFQRSVSCMWSMAPDALAITEFKAKETESSVWSLRVYSSFERGFKAHLPFPSWMLFRQAFNFMSFVEIEDVRASFPLAYVFSTKDDINDAISMNPGNGSYEQNFWGEQIGPLPDFGKGFTSTINRLHRGGA
eukprot:TRINITY_DN107329_c0_g1_i1.p1 TRINITY_DN107329_c0_g1~~TRINITY_DN107329_c0_g1_i1.p1  ORF type:complete len:401 (-),score=67.98 TRINITY_DN107329_c0_g1_i1:157-1224(-)